MPSMKRKSFGAHEPDRLPKKSKRPNPEPKEREDPKETDSPAEELPNDEESEEQVIEVPDNGEDVPAEKSFEDLGIIESLCEACTLLGYKAPTPIQAESIPVALSGKDIIGLAETGSGKTAAFALPILQALMDAPQSLFGLVLAPTRELAYQISQQFEALGSLISVRCAVLVGGMDMVSQSIALGKKPHVIVATPGRLLDHLENTKGFNLRNLKYLVMDEADRLLDLDFGDIIDKILRIIPRERHTYLFSATMSNKVESLVRAGLKSPVRISISKSSHQTVASLLQFFLFVPHKHKDLYLLDRLNTMRGKSTIIFTRTVAETARIAYLLRALGLKAIPIHGELSQTARLGALNKFRSKFSDILVATDVAARGLDIPSVDAVINYDLPGDSKTYVHRVGRTARAGKSGRAISVVTQYDVDTWLRIENALGMKVPEETVEKDEVMLLSEAVSEAQRVAVRKMRDDRDKKGKKGVGGMARRGMGKTAKKGRDEMDRDVG
ncbi:ATP-dependent rRNA helicase RRP3 [Aulographum hederae CBS 113979]|uniref:ATP-dependent rRNA helicase RRP3 n=1 Tax=Aulographum hederae CBS 113979 TaxID=1176131 RepID=A0A6G1H245_9PEZI|nr:ATP-dependent rRNA helicase RRP3 [Aulographum hederae CBS 113979]